MAEPTTWTELQANIADWLNRTDLTVQITEFIGYAERRFNRILRVPEMEDSVTTASTGATVTLPADFLAVKSLYIDGDSRLLPLRQLGLDVLRSIYSAEETGDPEYFALQSGNELVLAPAPTESKTYILNYYKEIPQLGAALATNWLLDTHPDLYLSQAMVEAMIFLRDKEGLVFWEQRAAGKMAETQEQGRRKALGETRARLRISDMPRVSETFNIRAG